MSTRQFENNAQRIPELRASAQKYKRPSRPEADYLIDSSALGRAFPDFSQGGNSSDEGDISVEVGRGAKIQSSNAHQQPGEFSSSFNLDHSLSFEQPYLKENLHDHHQPRGRQQLEEGTETVRADGTRNPSQPSRASGLRNQFIPSPPTKLQDNGSGKSRKSSSGSRRTLSAMHAKARDENEKSLMGDERPPSVDLTVRNTRFSNGRQSEIALEGNMPTKFSFSRGFEEKGGNRTKGNNAATPEKNRHSFVLPTMPNMSELVSGVFEDGTPVFGRQRKSQTSQAISGRQNLGFADVDEVPVPLDEQAIFLSLKLLQDKVALLERQKAEAQVSFKEIQDKNRQLEAEKTQGRRNTHRSDSALGTTDSEGGDEMAGNHQKGRFVKNNRMNPLTSATAACSPDIGLDSNIRALQKELDASNHRFSTAEAIINNVTHERDSAVSQLGVAYVTIEQLKAENAALRAENAEVDERLRAIDSKQEPVGRDQQIQADILQRGSNGPKEAWKSVQHVQETVASSRRQTDRPKHGHTQEAAGHGIQPQAKKFTISDDDELFDLSAKPTRTLPKAAEESVNAHQISQNSRADRLPGSYKKTRSNQQASASFPPNAAVNGESSKNLTYLSFIDTRDIEQLRRTIEQERLEHKQRKEDRAGNVQANLNIDAHRPDQKDPSNAGLTRISSAQSLNATSNTATQHLPEIGDAHTGLDHNRRHSESSILSTKSRRRSNKNENMTSAFIIPDITMRSANEKHHTTSHKENVTVSKPKPVSELITENAAEEVGDVTMRPSQAPGLALASVIKLIEDEITKLKAQLDSYQKLYNSHNPALSKRKRKFVFHKMESVMQTIDAKSDQIYSLYDVLEGQKQSGQEMTEEQVEVTLQSIGVEAPKATQHDTDAPKRTYLVEERQPWDISSDDGSDDDLPWEGIESTGNTTRNTSRRTHERRGSRF